MSDNRPRRNIGIELLRIIAMLMIIGLHYMNFGGIIWNQHVSVLNHYLSWGLEALFFVAVDCYVLISGYFLVKSTNFHWSKVVRLWLQVVFYTILFSFLVYFYTGHKGSQGIFKMLMPVYYHVYWFITAYIGMYILSPYLAKFAQSMSQIEYKKMLIICFFMFSVYAFMQDPFQMKSGYSFAWFIVLFFWGGYLRLWGIHITQKKAIALYVGCSILTVLGNKLISLSHQYLGLPAKIHGFYGFYQYTSPTVLLAATGLFLFFLQLRVSKELLQKMILRLSPLAFGVYLIHENPYVRQELWHHWLHPVTMYQSPNFVIHLFVCVIVIYLLAGLLEWGRQYIFQTMEPILLPIIRSIYKYIRRYV